jgi:AcrR family transcriptional regulator
MTGSTAEKKIDSRARHSLTRKGRQTRRSILQASREVFEKQGFYSASVAGISRRAGMSQGAFYQYFKNKEQVFLELNDRLLEQFWKRANELSLEHLSPEQRLRGLIDLLYSHCRENHFFHRILGEFELIDSVTIGYFESIARYCRSVFRRAVTDGYIRRLDPNIISYGVIGMALFHSMDWEPDTSRLSDQELLDASVALIERGVAGIKPWSMPKDMRAGVRMRIGQKPRALSVDLTQGQVTARSLLEAAEAVFGRYGYHRAGISDITRTAGVAQGTFYRHFKTKRDLMENFVRHLSREVRRELKIATEHLSDRRDVERVGIVSFFRFLSQHRRIYRVVTESETMGQKMAMWYYSKLAEGYRSGLEEGAAGKEIRDDLPVTFMVRSLMGIVHMIGLKWLVWNSSPQAEVPAQQVEDVLKMILFGLKID